MRYTNRHFTYLLTYLLSWPQNHFCLCRRQLGTIYLIIIIAELMSGVVPGSGIGPIAFLIFLDDLAKKLESQGVQLKIFADDIKVYLSVCNSGNAIVLQAALNCIHEWATDWQLAISISKCNVLTIGRPNAVLDNSYHIDNNVLPEVTSCRDLGVTITVPNIAYQ